MGVKQQRIVAVDVGQHSLKMVLANGQGIITKATTVRIPDGVVSSTRLSSPEMLTAALREAKNKARISDKNCVLVVGGREVIIRYFNLPRMSDYHLYQNIVSELSPYLPFSVDNYTIDYAIKNIIKEGDSVEYSVMVVAVHNEVIMPYVDAFSKAGFKLSRIDIRDNSYEKLIKGMQLKNFRPKENFCVIDVGSSTTAISAYSDGRFFINNANNIGGNYFRDSIAELYNIDSIRAEEKKLELSKLSYDNQDIQVINTMNSFFEKIVTDATRVFEFFKSNTDGQNIDEIYLTGGSSTIKGMAAFVESSSDIPTMELRDIIKPLFNTNLIGELDIELYASAVGATFREVD